MKRNLLHPRVRVLVAALALLPTGCRDDAPLGPAGSALHLSLSGLRPLDPAREGSYEGWVLDAAGKAYSAGRFQPAADGSARLTLPDAEGVAFRVTVEPPGDADPLPSEQGLLTGRFRGGRAELRIEGALTPGEFPLREKPGQYTVFTPSDNSKWGYPSHEEAGVWLFNSAPRLTEQRDFYVRLTPLRPGWVYEGWMVRDLGLPGETWLSYGKFTPSQDGAVDQPDDTGWGPFSGVDDFRDSRAENFPGDDWVGNPLNFPFPSNLTLPVDLREKDAAGQYRWTHIITVEPARDRGEAISTERPFLLRPYVDRFTNDGISEGPGRPRPITLRPEGLPSGTVEAR